MRRKIGQPIEGEDELPELTEQQMKFVEGILAGLNATEAYRRAYDCSNTSAPAISVDACRLKQHPKVSLVISAARESGLSRAILSQEQYIQRLNEAEERCWRGGNQGAAVQALQLAGKVMGHYTEHVEHTFNDPLQTLREIAAFAPELAAKLAADQGIEWSETQH